GLCAAAWAGNPDGEGAMHLVVGGLSGYQGESGTYVPPPFGRVYRDYSQVENDNSWGLNETFVVNRHWTAEVATSWEDMVQDYGQADLTTRHYYDFKNETQSLHLDLGSRIYVASLFGRDWQADTDHPEGVLGWPTLWVRATWNQGTGHTTLLDNVGYNVILPPDLSQQSASLSLGVVLPLSQELAVTASFARNVLNLAEQDTASSANLGSNDSFDAGASYHLLFRDPDPAQDYFPRIGRPGQALLSADIFSTRAVTQDANLAAGLNLGVAVPLGGRYAVELAWAWNHQYRQVYDRYPYFSPVVQGRDPQYLHLTLSYSFGDASRNALASAASTATAISPAPTAPPAAAASPAADPSATPADGQTQSGAANQGVGNTPPPEPTIK
ncbi:MAG TPA: hypothetical protein VNZ67_03640, partial [bacterium]|nr:hypothetical protein [bacterium]